MAETIPVYNLVGFLRVLYQRRWFIVIVTLLAGLVAAGMSLSVPTVFRAQTTVLLTVPRYKQNLTLVPKPLTVSVVRSMLVDPDTMREVIDRMAELNGTLRVLGSEDGMERLRGAMASRADAEDSLDWPELIAAADASTLVRVLLPEEAGLQTLAEDESLLWSSADARAQLVAILSAMTAEEARVVAGMEPGTIHSISPYALVRRLSASTTIPKRPTWRPSTPR